MATSARAQELAEQLLGLEATRTPLPAETRRYGMGLDAVKTFVQKNKKAVTITAVLVGAVVVYMGYNAWKKKKDQSM